MSKPWREQLAMAFGVGLPFVGLIVAIILAWRSPVGKVDLFLLAGFYLFTILGVTIGFHRMFTHRALKAGPIVRFILAVAGSMSAQGSVLEWCAVHREHHKHTDRAGDPHSPHLHEGGWAGSLKGMLHSHFGWLFASGIEPADSVVADLLADPVLRFADRFFWLWMLLGWVLPALIAGLIFRTPAAALGGFIWGGLVRTFVLHHVTWSVNSVCHVWGQRPFDTPDHSKNNAIFGLLAFGEGWHNNHHAFPTSARHGLRWWQIDFTYWIIRGMNAAGLVTDVRIPPPAAIAARLKPAVPAQ
jgi:stearoyl-CoA desaturase (delta-9 desaturase)